MGRSHPSNQKRRYVPRVSILTLSLPGLKSPEVRTVVAVFDPNGFFKLGQLIVNDEEVDFNNWDVFKGSVAIENDVNLLMAQKMTSEGFRVYNINKVCGK